MSAGHPCMCVPAVRDEVVGETTEQRAIRLLEELCARLLESNHDQERRLSILENEAADRARKGRG